MKVSLTIHYRTSWGESLYVVGKAKCAGTKEISLESRLTLIGEDSWTADIELPGSTSTLEYGYIVRHDNGNERREWGNPRIIRFGKQITDVVSYDSWQDQPSNKPFLSTAFTECINRRLSPANSLSLKKDFVYVNVLAPNIGSERFLALAGSTEGLGNWEISKAIRLNDSEFPVWTAEIPRDAVKADTQFKFVILDKAGKVIAWENGANRVMGITAASGAVTLLTGLRISNPLHAYHGAGVAIPVFSVRTEEDFGVGDFISLKKMIDWASSTGQQFLQLLPINDTTMTRTWTDSYPYNANSTFALHPMYLRLEQLGKPAAKRMAYYESIRKELNALPEVDYERVNNVKSEYVAEMFTKHGAKILESEDFKTFYHKNVHWLRPYAAFCALRDIYGTPDFNAWGEFAKYDAEKVEKLIYSSKEHLRAVNIVYYVQYYLDKQMHEVRDYAHAKGVAIKGDIPIGISRTSVDAWVDTRLFNMDCQAGAPPDDFSVLGQNWGFPTYNWEEMSRDGFAWWKARFRKMAEYFDAYRIDHVLGFFRIWQIPMDAVHGLLGVFNPALPFSPDEMRSGFDFWFNHELHTKPFIMDYMLGDFFGEFTDEARTQFLEPIGYGRYRLQPLFDTQRKVVDYFADKPHDDRNDKLCNALLGLIDDVLFIEDPYEKGKYHPRISAQHTYVYRSLGDYERWCFDRLYNDFFYHRHNDFWYGKAMWKLPPLIDATNMLVCAEDLGMIPACVPAVMERLEILALEIQRMPKDPKQQFGDTWHYPYYSVCTTSTHDMGGIRSWWEENREKTQQFYNHVLGEPGEAPYFAEPWICAKILEYHFRSPSMLCIIPLADLLSMNAELRRNDPREETINVPANPRHYWRYRMHLTVEKLIQAEQFNIQLKLMLQQAGR